MRLAQFIRSNQEAIVREWEAFARTCSPAADQMDRAGLRDHILNLLRFIADDLLTAQTELERSEKSKGLGDKEGGADDSAAETHADLRFTGGFDTVQMISEFRALRASVVKLWSAQWTATEDALPDLVRFNEAIDQAMTESLTRFTDKLDHSRDLFLGTLVHDFRSPLAAISTSAQVLSMRDTLESQEATMVSQITISAARLSRLVSDLVDTVRVRLGKGVPLLPTPMDIGTAVQEAVQEVRAAHPDRDILVKTSGNLIGEWDRNRVGQVLSNLISNAVQHGVRTAAIDVAAIGAGQDVILSVHNEGTIPANAVANVFDALVRGEDEGQALSAATSLGLGLFIAREIVNAHGGQIDVTSNEREGTTFTAHLPRKVPQPVSIGHS